MWSLIKWAFFLAIIGSIVLWFTGYKVGGKTIQQHLQPVLGSKLVKEGVRDFRSIVGEGLKAAGEVISEDVTDSERKQLDNLVRQEMQNGRPAPASPALAQPTQPSQTALQPVAKPVQQPNVKTTGGQTPPTTTR